MRKIFKQVYSAISYLHEHSIAHRDIKSENILLDRNYNAKLIDFGLAVQYTKGEKLWGYCGSPSYLAPEMINRKGYDPEMVDVWCLGVTLYVMITGSLPFYSQDPE